MIPHMLRIEGDNSQRRMHFTTLDELGLTLYDFEGVTGQPARRIVVDGDTLCAMKADVNAMRCLLLQPSLLGEDDGITFWGVPIVRKRSDEDVAQELRSAQTAQQAANKVRK